MPSRFPIAPLLGALIHLVRYEPHATESQSALLAAIRGLLGPEPLQIAAERDSLLLNGEPIPLNAPGASLLHEQLLLHGIGAIELPGAVTDAELLRLASVLAAFAGAYQSHAGVLAALGASLDRLRVSQASEDLEVYSLPWRPRRSMVPNVSAEPDPLELPRDVADGISLNVSPPEDAAESLSGGVPTKGHASLGTILQRGRQAVEREDWEALLDAALQLIEAEDEAPSERTGRTYRLELKRLVSREHLRSIARMAHGERRQEAIGLLRRFGDDATEALVDLLVAATTLGERRGYYTAITQIGAGAKAIIAQLDHPLWYVVRNAAELCGDMDLGNAVPALGRQIAHPDERVRKSVAGALGRIGSPLALEWLRKLFADPSPVVRRQAVVFLQGPRARELCGALAGLLLQETNPEVQREALLALGRVGSQEAITILDSWAAPASRKLERRTPALRVLAVKGLSLAGPAAEQVLSQLTRDEAPEVRTAASAALAALRP